MKYFVIANNYAEKGVPLFLDGAMHEKFIKNYLDEGMTYEWHKKPIYHGEKAYRFPKELWFITNRMKKYDLDCMQWFFGLLISESMLELLELLEEFCPGKVRVARLHMVNTKEIPITGKTMFFAKVDHLVYALDRERSEWTPSYGSGSDIINTDENDIAYVEAITRAVLTDKVAEFGHFFAAREFHSGGYLCSEVFVEAYESRMLKGITFIPVEEYNSEEYRM